MKKKELIKAIDLAGSLNTDIKTKTKDLDKLKTVLRAHVKENKEARVEGAQFVLRAEPYVAVSVDGDAIVKKLIGVKPNKIDPADNYVLTGAELLDLLKMSDWAVAGVKEVYGETDNPYINTETKEFHSLNFDKK